MSFSYLDTTSFIKHLEYSVGFYHRQSDFC